MDNVRCLMAGDTYSFVIENFQEINVGRYSITAENPSGKATCSAELVTEGSEFRGGGQFSESSFNQEIFTSTENASNGAAAAFANLSEMMNNETKSIASSSSSRHFSKTVKSSESSSS